MAQELAITDPRSGRAALPLERGPLSMINDPRDLPFVRLSLAITLVLIPFAIFLYWPGQFRWWLGGVYLAVNVFVFFDRFILMLHNTSHRMLYRKRFKWLNRYIPWVIGPLFGETPETYFVHHMGMHHAEGNMPDDLSSTMRYRRDSFLHFMRYFFAFVVVHPAMSRYLRARGRDKLHRRFFVGEGLYFAGLLLLLWLNWQATLVVFVVPLVMARFLMMAGNWGQHAFVDQDEPDNDYKSSITCINSRYNQRCFNDGYHIGHHVKPNRHWTELPEDFLQTRDEYARQDAIIFEKIDFFIVWLFLMLKRYDKLADHFVELRETPRSREEIIALLRARTQPFAL